MFTKLIDIRTVVEETIETAPKLFADTLADIGDLVHNTILGYRNDPAGALGVLIVKRLRPFMNHAAALKIVRIVGGTDRSRFEALAGSYYENAIGFEKFKSRKAQAE